MSKIKNMDALESKQEENDQDDHKINLDSLIIPSKKPTAKTISLASFTDLPKWCGFDYPDFRTFAEELNQKTQYTQLPTWETEARSLEELFDNVKTQGIHRTHFQEVEHLLEDFEQSKTSARFHHRFIFHLYEVPVKFYVTYQMCFCPINATFSFKMLPVYVAKGNYSVKALQGLLQLAFKSSAILFVNGTVQADEKEEHSYNSQLKKRHIN
jgi:hypothetical protein